MMLKFSLDSQGSTVLKQSEFFKVENVQKTSLLSLKRLKRGSIEDVYVIKDNIVSGIQLIEEMPGSVGDYIFIESNKIRLLQESDKLKDFENFYVVITSKESVGEDRYLFEEDSEGRNIVNSTIGDDFVTLIQKVYVSQEEYSYRRIIITQIDLSPYYGLKPEYFKFQYGDEEGQLGIDIDELDWYDSLSIEELQVNGKTTFFIKLLLPKTGVTTINRDIQIQYTAYEY